MYLYRHFNSQKEKPDECSANDGPSCNFLNNKILGENYNSISDINLKEEVINIRDKLSGLRDDDKRKNHDPKRMSFFTSGKSKLDLEFDRISTTLSDGEFLWRSYTFHFNDILNVKLSGIPQKIQKAFEIHFSAQLLYAIDFDKEENLKKNPNMYIIPKNLYFPASDKIDKINEKFDKNAPNSVYLTTLVQTNPKIKPSIKFTKPVRFRNVYLRVHDFKKVKKAENGGITFRVITYLNNEMQYFFSADSFSDSNGWVSLRVDKSTTGNNFPLIDKIEFEDNTDIDNLDVDIDIKTIRESESASKILTIDLDFDKLKKLQEMINNKKLNILEKLGDLKDNKEIIDVVEKLTKNLASKLTGGKSLDELTKELQTTFEKDLKDSGADSKKLKEFNDLLTKFQTKTKDLQELVGNTDLIENLKQNLEEVSSEVIVEEGEDENEEEYDEIDPDLYNIIEQEEEGIEA